MRTEQIKALADASLRVLAKASLKHFVSVKILRAQQLQRNTSAGNWGVDVKIGARWKSFSSQVKSLTMEIFPEDFWVFHLNLKSKEHTIKARWKTKLQNVPIPKKSLHCIKEKKKRFLLFFPECNAPTEVSCKASGIYSIFLAQRRWLAALYSEKAPFVSSWGMAEQRAPE